MNACAECGRSVDGPATYCDACADHDDAGASPEPNPSGRATRDVVASPVARATAAFLLFATVLGGLGAANDLTYVPQVLSYPGGVGAVGFLVTLAVEIALLAAFAVMAKRLYDGTADVPLHGRVLQALAVVSLSYAVVVSVAPEPLVRWFPPIFDPGYVILNRLAFRLAPDVFAVQWAALALGALGATVTFLTGTALRRY